MKKVGAGLLLLLSISGCTKTPNRNQIRLAESSSGNGLTFAELSPDDQLKYAQGQLGREEMRFKRALYAFLHFMNDNQTKWEFRLPEDISVSVIDANHFSVAAGARKPYSYISSIGSILAIDRQRDIRATTTFHGMCSVEHPHVGWTSFVTGWWGAEIHGEEVIRGNSEEDTTELDELIENLNDAMHAFFDTYFGRDLFEPIKDHMLHNPLFF